MCLQSGYLNRPRFNNPSQEKNCPERIGALTEKTLRLARLAAMRLTQAADTGWTAGADTLTSPLP